MMNKVLKILMTLPMLLSCVNCSKSYENIEGIYQGKLREEFPEVWKGLEKEREKFRTQIEHEYQNYNSERYGKSYKDFKAYMEECAAMFDTDIFGDIYEGAKIAKDKKEDRVKSIEELKEYKEKNDEIEKKDREKTMELYSEQQKQMEDPVVIREIEKLENKLKDFADNGFKNIWYMNKYKGNVRHIFHEFEHNMLFSDSVKKALSARDFKYVSVETLEYILIKLNEQADKIKPHIMDIIFSSAEADGLPDFNKGNIIDKTDFESANEEQIKEIAELTSKFLLTKHTKEWKSNGWKTIEIACTLPLQIKRAFKETEFFKLHKDLIDEWYTNEEQRGFWRKRD